jgi:hypothetical protein
MADPAAMMTATQGTLIPQVVSIGAITEMTAEAGSKARTV